MPGNRDHRRLPGRHGENEDVSRAAPPQGVAHRACKGGRMMGSVLQLDPAAHKVADALLPWFVNGTLDDDELAFVQKHLGRCASCQREVEWLRELHAACIVGEADPEAARALRQLRRRLEERPRTRGPMARLRNVWGQSRPWSRWVIATQLAVIVALGFWI